MADDRGREASATAALGSLDRARARRAPRAQLVWGVLGYLSFSSGVDEANERLPRRAKGSWQSTTARSSPTRRRSSSSAPTAARRPAAATRAARTRSCSCAPIRASTGSRTSRSRATSRVDIPGYGSGKINAANQFGGPALTLATVRALTGLPIHHVVVFDFDGFHELIDALGGVEIDVPKPILSNKFDCPYKPARCRELGRLAVREGDAAHGRAARARLRARSARTSSTPSDNDLTRGGRQQAVADAVGDKIASVGHVPPAPVHRRLARGAARHRSVRLGDRCSSAGCASARTRAARSTAGSAATPSSFGGESVLLGSEDNVEVDRDVPAAVGAAGARRRASSYDAGCTRR